MEEKELNKVLRASAISHGLCAQWQKEWESDWDYDKMVSQFYRGMDFFLKERFMSNEFLKENFPQDFRRRNGILVDDTYSILNPKWSLIIGESKATIRLNGRQASCVYVADEARLRITARNEAFVIVHVLGRAQVTANQMDNARLTVIQHSEESIIITDGNVRYKTEFEYLK